MSIMAYFGSNRGDLRLKGKEVLRAVTKGLASDEERSRLGQSAAGCHPAPQGWYETVGDYDAVLRAHCRLDLEG